MSRIGKVIQVAGPAVDIEFPEGQIPVIRTAIRITSEGFNVPEPINIICEVAQHIGESRVRTIALQPTDGLVRGMHAESLGEPVTVPVGKRDAGPRAERDRRAGGQDGSGEHGEALSDSSPGAGVRRAVDRTADVRDRHQGGRSARAVLARRKDRAVRRRGRRQDGHHSGADHQPGHQARRRFGVRGRGRAHARRQRSVAGVPGIARDRSARLDEIEVRADLRADDGASRGASARRADAR